jgi:hypothetical protein
MPSTQVVGGADALGLANWIQNQFSGTTYQPNAMDVQHEPLYDRSWNPATNAPWAAGAVITNLTQFFTTGNQTGKTLADTNVQTAKRLDAPQAFAAMGIGLWFDAGTLLADLNTMLRSFALEFWIGEKSYNRAPLIFYPVGGGVTGFSSASTALTNGMPGKMHRHELGINIVIDNQASFYCQLVGTSVTLTTTSGGGTGLNMQVILDGLHARGVQ